MILSFSDMHRIGSVLGVSPFLLGVLVSPYGFIPRSIHALDGLLCECMTCGPSFPTAISLLKVSEALWTSRH